MIRCCACWLFGVPKKSTGCGMAVTSFFFGYEFTTWSVYNIPPLRVIKRSKTDSSDISDIRSHEVSCLQNVHLASIASCDAEWLKYGSASDSGGEPEVVVVEPSVLDEQELLFKRDAPWQRDWGFAKPGLQKQ